MLKPGGRLAIADVVNINALPPELASDKALLCGCVAGAAPGRADRGLAGRSGFIDIRIQVKPESREYDRHLGAGTRHRELRRLGHDRGPQA